MKVLVIVGSPRKGNTYRLAQQFEEQLRALGEVTVEYLFLRDARLEMCRGCCVCFVTGEQGCPLKDDREAIERRLLEADGVVFASPVYALDMSAWLKNLMDRLAYTMHRPRFHRQKAVLLATAAVIGLKETLDRMAAVSYCGFQVVARVGAVTPDEHWPPLEAGRVSRDLAAAARKLHAAMTAPADLPPPLASVIAFRVQQAVYPLLKERHPVDHAYFQNQGWLDPAVRFYTQARVGFLKNAIARGIAWQARRNVARQLSR